MLRTNVADLRVQANCETSILFEAPSKRPSLKPFLSVCSVDSVTSMLSTWGAQASHGSTRLSDPPSNLRVPRPFHIVTPCYGEKTFPTPKHLSIVSSPSCKSCPKFPSPAAPNRPEPPKTG
jgi:hypothetical protein